MYRDDHGHQDVTLERFGLSAFHLPVVCIAERMSMRGQATVAEPRAAPMSFPVALPAEPDQVRGVIVQGIVINVVSVLRWCAAIMARRLRPENPDSPRPAKTRMGKMGSLPIRMQWASLGTGMTAGTSPTYRAATVQTRMPSPVTHTLIITHITGTGVTNCTVAITGTKT